MPLLPKRIPDFYVQLTAGHKIPGWQEPDHYVVALKLQNAKDLIVAQLGQYRDTNNDLRLIIFKNLLDLNGTTK